MKVHHGSRFNPELLKTPVLMGTIDSLTKARHWWAILTEANGTQHAAFPPAAPGEIVQPDPTQEMFAKDMGTALNKHLHHDGAWVVALLNPRPRQHGNPWVEYDGFMFVFLDRDGDPQFIVENDEPWWKVMEAGPDVWIEQAEQAWLAADFFLGDVDRPEEATYHPAQGEAAPSTRR